MSRPRNPIGTYGTINTKQIEPDKWRARTRYRFRDGKLKQVERFGTTETKAKAALRKSILAIDEGRGGALKPSLALADLGDRFLQDRKDVGRSAGTLETYGYAVNVHIKPGIGSMTVGEATPERLQEFLTDIHKTRGPGAAKNSRSALSGMLGLAVRNGAADRNPVRELDRIQHKGVKGSSVIPTKQLTALLRSIRADDYLTSHDTADLFEFMAGTGWRVAEACGLAWDDVNLTKNTVTMCAIAVRVTGQGMIRQQFGKTDSAARTITVPKPVMQTLKRRQHEQPDNDLNLVFPTALGRLRDPSNTERELRDRRQDLGHPNITTHSFRKTVATALDKAGMSARDIADYLGHKNPSVTQDVYMARNTGSKKAAQSLERLLNS